MSAENPGQVPPEGSSGVASTTTGAESTTILQQLTITGAVTVTGSIILEESSTSGSLTSSESPTSLSNVVTFPTGITVNGTLPAYDGSLSSVQISTAATPVRITGSIKDSGSTFTGKMYSFVINFQNQALLTGTASNPASSFTSTTVSSGSGLETSSISMSLTTSTPGTSSNSMSLTTTPFNGNTSSSTSTVSESSSKTSIHTPPPTANNKSNHHLSDGTAAGVIVGVSIAVALITFFIAWLFFKSRKRSSSSTNSISYTVVPSNSPGKPTSSLREDHDGLLAAPFGWMKHLPQGVDDRTLSRQVLTLFDHLDLHVDNFYGKTSSSLLPQAPSELSQFQTPYLLKSLATSLENPESQASVIKHCLIFYVLSRIAVDSDPGVSYLPSALTSLPHTLATMGKPKNQQETSLALSHWRVLTIYLLPSPAQDKTYLQQRKSRIQQDAVEFCHGFELWARREHTNSERFNNLVSIMEHAATLGILLFSQPADFTFDWKVEGAGEGKNQRTNQIAIYPSLYKKSSAGTIGSDQLMVKAVVAQL